MQRVIYEVYAKVVDANGAYNTLTGYPKVFDSKYFQNDVDKTLLRAKGEFGETYGAMSKRDDRKMQTLMLMTADGFVLQREVIGSIPEEPGEVIPEE